MASSWVSVLALVVGDGDLAGWCRHELFRTPLHSLALIAGS
jgi:hypothetical protein